MAAAEGIREFFEAQDNVETEFYFLEDVEKLWEKDASRWQNHNVDHQSIIAVGPESVLFLNKNPSADRLLKVFTMVSDPSGLLREDRSRFCGHYLSVNAEDHVVWIGKIFPHMAHLGILYDGKYNTDYMADAQRIGRKIKMAVRPLKVDLQGDVPAILRENWEKLDGLLLIPDATVISESLVKYIIKDGISNNVPVIGYNRFFIRNGAMMAFVHDYQKVGYNSARLAKEKMEGKHECRIEPAEFKIVINSSIAKHLNVELSHAFQYKIVEENE